MTWHSQQPQQRKSKHRDKLAEVKAGQSSHPDEWMEMYRYARTATAYETATKLNEKHPDYRFRGEVDQNTREGVLYTRYIGGETDDE